MTQYPNWNWPKLILVIMTLNIIRRPCIFFAQNHWWKNLKSSNWSRKCQKDHYYTCTTLHPFHRNLSSKILRIEMIFTCVRTLTTCTFLLASKYNIYSWEVELLNKFYQAHTLIWITVCLLNLFKFHKVRDTE